MSYENSQNVEDISSPRPSVSHPLSSLSHPQSEGVTLMLQICHLTECAGKATDMMGRTEEKERGSGRPKMLEGTNERKREKEEKLLLLPAKVYFSSSSAVAA